MPQLTKTVIDRLQPGEIAFDSRLTGFGVRCQRNAKIYFVKTRVRGRQRWFTIGRHGSPFTVETARARARALIGEVASGQDPAGARDAEKAAGTFAELAEKYLAEYAETHKKPRSVESDATNLRINILPALGRRRVVDITRTDIAALHHALRRKPGAANRCLSLLSKMFNLAEKWGLRSDGTNPVRHIERFPARKMERFLSSDEMARVGAALKQAESSESPYAIAAIRLLMLTGARKSEIFTAKWEYLDRERGALVLPDSKTGAKTIPLGAPALAVLHSLSVVAGNPYILVSRGKHIVSIRSLWRRVRLEAGLGACRLHDLRHSFASVGAAGGDSLLVIGTLLGHTQPQTTARYSHLSNDPLRAAADRIAGSIAAAMLGKDAEVVEMRPKAK